MRMIGQISIESRSSKIDYNLLSSKKDPCGICHRNTMANAVLCKSYGDWIHGRCAEIGRMSNTLAINFKCWKCKGCHKKWRRSGRKLHEDVKKVIDFSYLGDRIYSGGGCEAAVTSRTRLEWVKF